MSKTWKRISWGSCCSDTEVLTDATEPDCAGDGDEARCLGCGRPGTVWVDSEDEAGVNWHDVEGCKCWWCQQADELDSLRAQLRAATEQTNRLMTAIPQGDGIKMDCELLLLSKRIDAIENHPALSVPPLQEVRP